MHISMIKLHWRMYFVIFKRAPSLICLFINGKNGTVYRIINEFSIDILLLVFMIIFILLFIQCNNNDGFLPLPIGNK